MPSIVTATELPASLAVAVRTHTSDRSDAVALWSPLRVQPLGTLAEVALLRLAVRSIVSPARTALGTVNAETLRFAERVALATKEIGAGCGTAGAVAGVDVLIREPLKTSATPFAVAEVVVLSPRIITAHGATMRT